MNQFKITASGPFSEAFRQNAIMDCSEAADFVRQLPYKRNRNKHDLLSVFTDGHGTCSTKHALLKQLATENAWEGFRLMLCVFKMDGNNTPPIAGTLKRYKLPYIPEAHNYLRVDGTILDCTTPGSKPENFINDLLFETEIDPGQITGFKVDFHRRFLQNWLEENKSIACTPDELFAIREQCIKDLENA